METLPNARNDWRKDIYRPLWPSGTEFTYGTYPDILYGVGTWPLQEWIAAALGVGEIRSWTS